jgi:hypothetical protein
VGTFDLFSHVGEVEINRKGASQFGRRLEIGGVQDGCGRGWIGTNRQPNRLHLVQEQSTLLANQGLTEEIAQQANVSP